MPYSIKHVRNDKNPWKIIRRDDGKVVGESKTHKEAAGSIWHRMHGEGKGKK